MARRDADVVVLALGGASWPRLGGDGAGSRRCATAGVDVAPLAPANMGLRVAWSAFFRERFAGQPVKAARWTLGDAASRAEAVVTAEGLEGGAIYALSGGACAERGGAAAFVVDLKPDQERGALAARLAANPSASRATRLAKAGLSPLAAGLMREAGELPADAAALAARAKNCPVRVVGVAGLERAISSAGGVRWSAIDERFHAAGPAGRVRRRRNDRLGGADRRVPAASLLSTGAAAGRGRASEACAPEAKRSCAPVRRLHQARASFAALRILRLSLSAKGAWKARAPAVGNSCANVCIRPAAGYCADPGGEGAVAARRCARPASE